MQIQLRSFSITNRVAVAIAYTFLLSACGGGSSSSAPNTNSNVSGVTTPSKVSIVNTNQ